ncbi:ACT domain-containing protein [Massilia sp. W12]|uniref:ACT domain-containing protein n=1 Tax=Massilia sp. W12 TaxID=3126507 RepID=UPI0030D269C6
MTDCKLNLLVLAGEYVVAHLTSLAQLHPAPLSGQAMYSLTVTPDELSFIGPAGMMPPGLQAESRGWRCLRIDGELAFDQVGVVATVSSAIAAQGISVFAISSHDRDHFLVQAADLPQAILQLRMAGCNVNEANV